MIQILCCKQLPTDGRPPIFHLKLLLPIFWEFTDRRGLTYHSDVIYWTSVFLAAAPCEFLVNSFQKIQKHGAAFFVGEGVLVPFPAVFYTVFFPFRLYKNSFFLPVQYHKKPFCQGESEEKNTKKLQKEENPPRFRFFPSLHTKDGSANPPPMAFFLLILIYQIRPRNVGTIERSIIVKNFCNIG